MNTPGVFYRHAGNGPTAYDCSGFTTAAFRAAGISLPRTAAQQSTVGTTVSISDLQAGDLVFWGGRGSAYHVAVYAGGGMILDAGTPASGVTERRMFGGASHGQRVG